MKTVTVDSKLAARLNKLRVPRGAFEHSKRDLNNFAAFQAGRLILCVRDLPIKAKGLPRLEISFLKPK